MEAQLYIDKLYIKNLTEDEVRFFVAKLGDNAFNTVSLGNRLVLALSL